jgi:hypothetical protein
MKYAISLSYAAGAAIAAMLALAAPRAASAGEGHHGSACAADVQTLCATASGWDEIRRCLWDHKDQVSPACAEKMEAKHQRHLTVRNACQGDLANFCPDAQGRDIRQCLHEHRDELSEGCSQTLQTFHHHCDDKAPS